MASTYSPNLKVELITPGEQAGSWGTTTNNNFVNVIEQAIAGTASVVFPSDADYTLTLTDTGAATTQAARAYHLLVTSGVSLSTTRTLTVPAIDKAYIVTNSTSGGRAITVARSGGGSTVLVPNGARVVLYCNSVGVIAQVSHVPALTVGSTTDSVVTVAGTQTLTNKTLTSPIMTAPSFSTINNGGTVTVPSGTSTLATIAGTQTLTNKTISGASNTISNIGNAALTNSSLTIGSTSVSLGGTAATVAGLTLTAPTISSITNGGTVTIPSGTSTLVTTTGTQTLTNKTLTSPTMTSPSFSTISNTGTLTLPTSTDTLVGRATTDTLTNKTISGGSITGITDLAIADGGTGASDAATARTNLGLASGAYVPSTSSLSAGITSLTDRYGQYIRVGNYVLVTGQVTLTTSTSGQFAFDASLPIASNFTDGEDCLGVASSSATGGVSGNVYANGTVMRVTIINPSASLFASPINWSATYVVK